MFKPNLTTKFVLDKIAHKLDKTLKRGTRQRLHFPKLESHRLKKWLQKFRVQHINSTGVQLVL
jgi:hypothetical protein